MQMECTTLNKKNTAAEHDLSEQGPMMKHGIDNRIVGKPRVGENWRDRSTDRPLKAPTMQRYTGLLDRGETEARDCRNVTSGSTSLCGRRTANRRLSAGADCPDDNGSRNNNWGWAPRHDVPFVNYMNQLRSLTNMSQELEKRQAQRKARRNVPDNAVQMPPGYDDGGTSMDNTACDASPRHQSAGIRNDARSMIPGPRVQRRPLNDSRIPHPRTCNEQKAAVVRNVPRVSQKKLQYRPSARLPRGSRNVRFTDDVVQEERCATQCPIRPSDDPQYTTCATHLDNVRRENDEDNAIAPCGMNVTGNPRVAEPVCPIPRCSIPLSKPTPRFDSDSPDQYEQRRLSMERFLNEYKYSYKRPLGSPPATVPNRDRCPTDNVAVTATTCQATAPNCPSRNSGKPSVPQCRFAPSRQATPVRQAENHMIRTNTSGHGTSQCSLRTAPSPRHQTHEKALGRHRIPARQKQNNHLGSRRQTAPPRYHYPANNGVVPRYHSPSNPPNDIDALVQFLNGVHNNDVVPAGALQPRPKQKVIPSMHRQQCQKSKSPNDADALVHFLNRINNNDAVPAAAPHSKTPVRNSRTPSRRGSLKPKSKCKGPTVCGNRPTARQEQNDTVRISEIKAHVSPDGRITDVTPPSSYFDLDFSDESDNESNRC